MQSTYRRLRRITIMTGVVISLLAAFVVSSAVAAPAMHGSFATPTKTGTISYTVLRAFRGGSEGTFIIAGKSSPGAMFAARGGGIGFDWFYGSSGIMAGDALVTLQANGQYSGPIWFLDRSGNTIDTGTVTVTFP